MLIFAYTFGGHLMFENFISPDAEFVKILGIQHLTYLTFCICTVIVFIIKHKFVLQHQNTFRKVFLVLLAFQQTFLLYGWYYFATPNFLSEGLPLQLCRVASLLRLYYLISGSKLALDVLCYFSIYALISFFYPLSVYNFSHISGISYMINHLITVLIPIFAFIKDGWFFSWKSYKNAVIAFSIYFPIVIVANHLTNGNYFYQVDRPFFHSMSPFLFGTLTYVVTVVGFAIVNFAAILLKKAIDTKLKANAAAR